MNRLVRILFGASLLMTLCSWAVIYFSAQYEASRFNAQLEANQKLLNPEPICFHCSQDYGWVYLGTGILMVAGGLGIAAGMIWIQDRSEKR